MAANLVKTTWSNAKADLSGNYARGIILCDTAADLPAPTAFSGFELVQGTVAHIIDDDKNKMMQSDGTWSDYTPVSMLMW